MFSNRLLDQLREEFKMIVRLLALPAIRFLLIGGANTVAYAILSFILVFVLNMRNDVSAIIAYIMCVPLAFLAHKSFVFRSDGHRAPELVRFIIVNLTNMFFAYAIAHMATTVLQWPRAANVVTSTLVVACSSYAFMKLWVFRADSH